MRIMALLLMGGKSSNRGIWSDSLWSVSGTLDHPVIEADGFYWPQRSCGQGYVFTRVCDSVNRGGSASVHAGIPTPLGADTPRSKHPPEQTPRKQTPPWEQTPPEQTPPPPGSRFRDTVNERLVRILLECILVVIVFKLDVTKISGFS